MKRLLALVVLALTLGEPTFAQSPFRIVEDERAKIASPTLSEEQAAVLMRAIASRLNAEGVPGGPFGVLIKTTGANCGGISCDIICTGNGIEQMQWDVLIDSNRPSWSLVSNPTVRPCEIPGVSAPPLPVPHQYDGGDNDTGICDICGFPRSASIHTGPPPPPACLECESALNRTRTENALLRTQMNTMTQELGARIATLEAELDLVRARALTAEAEIARRDALPPPRCTASIWGIKVKCRIVP